MHFKDIKLSRRASPDGGDSSRPGTPGEVKSGRRGRSFLKTADSTSSVIDGNLDPDLNGRLPKRSNSFGLGLGGLQSIANGMSRAGETISRKTTGPNSDGTKTPPVAERGASTMPNIVPMGPPSLPDSSHLAQFSLKLSELVNRAFMPCTGGSITATPSSGGLAGAAKNAAAMTSVGGLNQGIPALSAVSYGGKKLPSKAIVTEIAKTVVAELNYSSSVDPYLLRAVSRSALKALTLFANRIDTLLVPASKDGTVNFVPTTAKEGIHLPAGLEFNLGLVTLEWIVEDALERCIEGPPGSLDEGMPHFVSEILTPVRKKMEGTILHVIQPMISSVKVSLTQCLSKAVPMPFSGFGHSLSPAPSATVPLPDSVPGTPSGIVSPHTTLILSSTWLRELEGRLEGNRRLLVPRIEERCGQDGEGWFISVAIHVIWKGLLILTSRAMPMPPAWTSKQASNGVPSVNHIIAAEANKRSPSPAQLTNALRSVSVKPRKLSGAELASGQATPSNFATPALSSSAKATVQQIQELQAFEKLILKFASGFQPSHIKTRTASQSGVEDPNSSDSDENSDDDDEDELARAALAEALQAIKSTILVVQYLDTQPEAILEAILPHRERLHSSTLPVEVIRAAKATPPLLLLQLMYSRMPAHLATFTSVIKEGGQRTEAIIPSPPGVFGYTWAEYEHAIAGFAGGQSWAYALVEAWKEDLLEASESLDARERKLVKEREGEHLPVSDASNEYFDPADSTPTPESVLQLRRTASARSTSDSSESIPEEMTASAPTLDREKETLASSRPSSSSGGNKPSSAWSTLKNSRKGTTKANDTVSEGTSSPDVSPPRSPLAVPVGQAAGTNAKPKRFWRSQSSQSQSNGGFHFSSVGRGRAISPNPAISSPTLTEEERQQEEIRLERRGVDLLKKAVDVVEAVRMPAATI